MEYVHLSLEYLLILVLGVLTLQVRDSVLVSCISVVHIQILKSFLKIQDEFIYLL